MSATEQRPRGRPRKQDADQPASWEEWEAEMMRLLWVRREDLKGTALTQALTAIVKIAEHQRERERPEENENARQVPLLERIGALPPEVAAELIRAELQRIYDLWNDYQAALAALEGRELEAV